MPRSSVSKAVVVRDPAPEAPTRRRNGRGSADGCIVQAAARSLDEAFPEALSAMIAYLAV